jgi:hypothetical protein
MPKRFAFPILAILIVLGAYSAYWFYARGQIETYVRDWEAAQVEAGYTIERDGPVRVGGFPYRFSVAADNVVMRAPASEGGWELRLASFEADALPYDFSHWIVSLGETFQLESGGEGLSFTAGEARFSIATRDGVTQRIGAEIAALTIEPIGATDSAITALGDLRLNAGTSEDGIMAVQIQMTGIDLDTDAIDPVMADAFGDHVGLLRADFTLSQWPELARTASLSSWSQAEGIYTLRAFQIDWGRLDMDAEGQMSLDDQLRPTGRLSLTLLDPEAIVDAMIEAGAVSEDNSGALRLVAQSAPRNDNGTAIPLSFRNGGVFFGPVRLGSVGPVLR